MTPARRWVALVGVALIALIVGASALLSESSSDMIGNLVVGGWLLIMGGVGGVILRSRPGHRIGMVLLSIAVIATVAMTLQEYAIAALVGDKDLPGGMVAAWFALWAAAPAAGLGILLVLVFPTGTLPSPRWKIVAAAIAVGTLVMTIVPAFTPGPMPAIPSVDNPLGIPGSKPVLEAIAGAGSLIILFAALASVGSQIVRLRRSQSQEAAQIKIVAYAIVMAPVLIFVSQAVLPQGGGDQWLEFALNMLAATSIPVAIGIAILKHRLYEIDVVINRTLVYGLLTATLLGAYLLIVFALSRVLDPVTRDSDVAVAASTLAVAALFRPLRTRIQRFIDRRFYRSRYDARRSLEGFGQMVRDQVEVDVLRGEVLRLVTTTIQPLHVSLWVRPRETA